MKKNVFLLGAVFAAGMLMTACSSENDAIQEETSLDSKFDAQGNAYINIAISMPTTSGGTRANGVFDDGTADEYAVKDALLVLFKGSNESDATFNGAYMLPTDKVKQTVSNNQITDRLLYAQQINKGENALSTSDHIYAFVVMNTNGKFEVTSNRGLTVKAVGGDQALTKGTTTFTTFKGYTLNTIGSTSSGLLMTNPPMCSAGGGSAAPTSKNYRYMPELTSEHIYNSLEAAYSGSKYVEIYVERAAAKINLNVPSGTSEGLKGDNTVTYDPSGIRWEVQNYNTSYYLSRHVSDTYLDYSSNVLTTPFYRFAEETAVDPTMSSKNYRIPWAEDANYSSAAPDNVPTNAETQATFTNTPSSIVYLAENTVDENSLKQGYTTRIVLAVPFNNGNSFYTSSLGGGDEIFSVDAMKTKVKAYILSQHGKTATDVEFTNAANGHATVNTVTLSDASDATAIVTDINTHAQFSYYNNGMAYYKVLIKHFGDVETPLRAATDIPGSTYDEVYPSTNRAQNYLGRYSVVRNNWYQITLDGIMHIGKPSVPAIVTETPDDEVDAYLKVRINILSWGIRTQNVTL